jgi:hypothetical protein
MHKSSNIKISHISATGRPGLQISGALYCPVELVQGGEDHEVGSLMSRLSNFLEKIRSITKQSTSEKLLIFGPSWSTLVVLIALALFDGQLSLGSKEVAPGLWTMFSLRPNLHFDISQLDEHLQSLTRKTR